MFWVYAALAVSLVSFFVAAYFYNWVKKLPTANPKLDEVGALIREGAFTFLRREYRVLGLFSIIVMAVIFLFFPQPVWAGAGVGKNLLMVFAYLCGTVLSALAGYVGISIATIANLKAATAARESIQKSFMAGFRGGAVMGMAVIGTSLAGAALIYIISRDADVIMAFSFGASSLALFAKAGGGIFTKTADIAADLTGKVAEKALVAADITVNKNMVPFDSRSPFQTSGLRFGTPAITTRGLKEDKMEEIVALIDRVLSDPENEANIAAVRKEVNAMMANYPLFAW